jgi:hypothetical protein
LRGLAFRREGVKDILVDTRKVGKSSVIMQRDRVCKEDSRQVFKKVVVAPVTSLGGAHDTTVPADRGFSRKSCRGFKKKAEATVRKSRFLDD